MVEFDENDSVYVLERIRAQVAAENIRTTQHAQQEMVEEIITLNEVLQVIASARIVENYPEHRRGPCCLLTALLKMLAPCILYVRQRSQR